jgi:hypothetical protein
MLERTRHLWAALAAVEGGLPERAAGHLAAARTADPLPALVGKALAAQRGGRGEELAETLELARRLLETESQGISRRDFFCASALGGLLAAEGRRDDSGTLAAELADEAIDALDGVRWAILDFRGNPAPGGNGAA